LARWETGVGPTLISQHLSRGDQGLAELALSQQGFGAMVGVRLSEEGMQLIDAWEAADSAFLTSPRRRSSSDANG
jgi:hypothetical protein